MRRRQRLKRSKYYHAPHGVKVVRRRQFEAVISTASGIRVRSKYEKRCAEFLHKNDIAFRYEPLMFLGGRQYRPDFFLPEYDVFLEICGYNHMPFYADRVVQKKQIYEKHGLKAVFVSYGGKGSLEQLIQSELQKFGIKTTLDD